MDNQLLGNPRTTATNVTEVKDGYNEIVVKTVFYGHQEMIMEKNVAIKLSDGATLYANVFRPNKPGEFPVVMSADTYGKDNPAKITHMPPIWPTLGQFATSDFTSEESPDPGFWVPNDYVVVKVALRGSARSKGALIAWSLNEGKDYAEAIEWAGEQEWSNGNVGTNGVSYLAVTQWWAASLNPSHLKAMIPWEGLNDMYREIAFHGGIPDTGFYRFWWQGIIDRWPENDQIEDLLGKQLTNTMFDDFWKQKQANISNIKVPMLVCASWSTQGLHNRGTFEGFKQAGSEDKWLKVHGRKEWETYYSREALEEQKQFFDYFLKGVENDWRDTPRVSYEVREKSFKGSVKNAMDWPLPNRKEEILYLNGSNKTLAVDPLSKECKVSYNAELDASEDNELRFQYQFSEDTELTGNMKLKLWVSTDEADDMDLFVGIKKLDRRGQEVYFPDFNHVENGQVATGWLRVSHRELDADKSTPAQPWHKHENLWKLKKGEIVPVEIEILPSSTLFKKGEALVVVIKGSDIVDRSWFVLKTNYEHVETLNKGMHHVYTGGQYDSHLLIPKVD